MKKMTAAMFFVAMTAGAAMASTTGAADPCTLIAGMQGIFRTLRTLAFAGAAIFIAGWAWSYIKGGEAKMDDIQKKGIGLLVGFSLLFGIGIVLQFLPGISGCPLTGW